MTTSKPNGHHHNHHHNSQQQSSTDCATEGEEDEQPPRPAKRIRRLSSLAKSAGCLGKALTAEGKRGQEEVVGNNGALKGEPSAASVVVASSSGYESVQLQLSSLENTQEENISDKWMNEDLSRLNCSLSNLKRSISSQTTDEDDEDTKSKKPRLAVEEDEPVDEMTTTTRVTIAERPKTLHLPDLLLRKHFTLGDSGFSSTSSYCSSGHESIPSPESASAGDGIVGEKGEKSVSMLLPQTGSLVGSGTSSSQVVSLSRDFCHHEKAGSWSDSETYRRTSSKCVVNKGEAHAITKRAVGIDATEAGGGGGEGVVKSLVEQYKEEERLNNLCIICVTEPKDSAFVHTRSLHICCCYKCAIKVWNKKKRCPICNCKVKNVLKCYVH